MTDDAQLTCRSWVTAVYKCALVLLQAHVDLLGTAPWPTYYSTQVKKHHLVLMLIQNQTSSPNKPLLDSFFSLLLRFMSLVLFDVFSRGTHMPLGHVVLSLSLSLSLSPQCYCQHASGTQLHSHCIIHSFGKTHLTHNNKICVWIYVFVIIMLKQSSMSTVILRPWIIRNLSGWLFVALCQKCLMLLKLWLESYAG